MSPKNYPGSKLEAYHHEGTDIATVELHIRPPLSYGITKEAGGLIIQQEFSEGETLGDMLARLEAQTPGAFQPIYDSGKGQIRAPIVTVVNGAVERNPEAVNRVLADGDRITWFFIYAGG